MKPNSQSNNGLAHCLVKPVEANAKEILAFLERDLRSIPPHQQTFGQWEEMESTVYFYVKRRGNLLSLYAKLRESEKHGKEVIRFEVIQRARTTSTIKAFYGNSNPHFDLMFYRIWSKFAVGFATDFLGEALRKLYELDGSKIQ